MTNIPKSYHLQIEGMSIADPDGQLLLIIKNLTIPVDADLRPLAPSVAEQLQKAMLVSPTITSAKARSPVEKRTLPSTASTPQKPDAAKSEPCPGDAELIDRFKTWYDGLKPFECEQRHGLSADTMRSKALVRQRTRDGRWRRKISKKAFDDKFGPYAQRLIKLLVERKIVKKGRFDANTTPMRCQKSDVAFYRIDAVRLKRIL